MSERVILPGGSGFLGRSFADYLTQHEYEVVILTRSPRTASGNVQELAWDGKTPGAWQQALEGAAAVVNFTGKSVNCRYTPENRREIIESRVDSVRILGQTIEQCSKPPPVFVQAGSLAIYGNTRHCCDENAPHGEGFSVRVCERWEAAFHSLDLPRTRQVLLRIGFALGKGGGALAPLAAFARFYLGGTIGSGNQYISWLHLDDLNEMLLWAMERDDMEGTYNATGPQPVTNAEFMRLLRQTLNRPWSPPVPALAVRIGSWLMRTEPELALTGRNCIPARLVEQGFRFHHTKLDEALTDIWQTP